MAGQVTPCLTSALYLNKMNLKNKKKILTFCSKKITPELRLNRKQTPNLASSDSQHKTATGTEARWGRLP